MYGVEGLWVQLLRGGQRARVIIVLRECIWNAPAVSLILLAFDDTGSLDSPPCRVVYSPGSMVPLYVIAPVSLRGIGRLS